MPSLSVNVPLVKSYVAKMAARGVSNQLVTLLELSEPMNGGSHYPLFLLVLQQLYKLHGSDWVTTTFQESKINLQDMLPGMKWSILCVCLYVFFMFFFFFAAHMYRGHLVWSSLCHWVMSETARVSSNLHITIFAFCYLIYRVWPQQRSYDGDLGRSWTKLHVSVVESAVGLVEADESRSEPEQDIQVDQGECEGRFTKGSAFH